MASIWKHPQSRYWYARFTNSAGVQQNRSTKTTDRKTAMRLADGYEDVYRRKLTEVQLRRVMSDINERLNGQALPCQTVKEFFTEWTASAVAETASTTGEKYKATAQDFVAWMGARAGEELTRVTTADISRWRDSLLTHNSPITARGKLKIIKTAFKRAWRMGLLMDDPAVKVPSPKVRDDSPRRPFTREELEHLFTVADTTWRGFILCGLYTGQRLKDICMLQWKNVIFNGEKCEIRLSTSKTDRRQIIPVVPSLKSWFIDNKEESGPVFPAQYKIATTTKNTGRVSTGFGELLVKAGLIEARPKSHKSRNIGRRNKKPVSELSFHSLRHTATSMLKELGVTDAVVMDIIGHESKAISRNYTHVSDASKAEAMAKLPDITKAQPTKSLKKTKGK